MSSIQFEPILMNFDDIVDENHVPRRPLVVPPKNQPQRKSTAFYYCSSCNVTICLNTKYKHMKTLTHLKTLEKMKSQTNRNFTITINENKITK